MAFKNTGTVEKQPEAAGTSISDRAKQAAGLPAPAPQTSGTFAPPAHLAEFAAQDAGLGVSTSAEDNLVPLLYVLQPLSPQVDRRSPQYIEGAEAGDIYLRNAPPGMEIIKANAENARAAGVADFGILAQPCHFYRDVAEWVPRDEGGGGGKGFVARHEVERAKEVAGAKPGVDRKTGKVDPNAWTTADGEHDLVENRNHAVLLHHGGRVLPYLIPLNSTGHSVSRAWMSKINQKVMGAEAVHASASDREAKIEALRRNLEAAGKPSVYPSFAYLYKLTTEQRQNNEGKWFVLKAEDARWATADEYRSGRRLNQQFRSGEKKAAAPEAEAGAGAPAAVSHEKVDAAV